MNKIIIGSEECKITEVALAVSECGVSSIVRVKWKIIAMHFKLSLDDIETLKRSFSTDSLEVLFASMLEKWVSLASHEATLEKLVAVFRSENIKLNNVADKLISFFCPEEQNTVAKAIDENDNGVIKTGDQEDGPQDNTQETDPLRNRTVSATYDPDAVAQVALKFLLGAVIPCIVFATFCGIAAIIIFCIHLVNKYISDSIANNNTTALLDPIAAGLLDMDGKLADNIEEDCYGEPFNATVSSWEEYENVERSKSNYSYIVNLTINLDNPLNWNQTVLVDSSNCIKKLEISGVFTLEALAILLGQLSKLRYLKLDNLDDKLCYRNLARNIHVNSVSLSRLKGVWLKDFTSCAAVYESLVRSYYFDNLEYLILDNVLVDHVNIYFIQAIIFRSKRLKQIDVLMSKGSKELLYKTGSSQMGSVEEILYNFVPTGDDKDHLKISDNFSHTFPNLTAFGSKYSYLSASSFTNLLNCTNLKYLKVNIFFNTTDRLGDLQLTSKLPKLLAANIFLYFNGSCPRTSNIAGLGLDNYGPKLRRLHVGSNCVLKRGKYNNVYEWEYVRSAPKLLTGGYQMISSLEEMFDEHKFAKMTII